MTTPAPVLHLICGKIASGKSTLARQLAEAPKTVLIGEDDWLATLNAGDMTTMADYMHRSARLRDALTPHVLALLGAGLSVVLDFQANTPDSRAWMRSLIDRAGADHLLHWLDLPDAVCKARLRRRNDQGRHAFTVSGAQFDAITRHFVPPAADERFNVVRYLSGDAPAQAGGPWHRRS